MNERHRTARGARGCPPAWGHGPPFGGTGEVIAPSVVLLTSEDWPNLTADDQILLATLRSAGWEASAQVWDDARPVDVDAVVVRSCWDFHRRAGEFFEVIAGLARLAPIFNRPEVMRWNADKAYLSDLGDAGVAVVPKIEFDGQTMDLHEQLQARGWVEFVVKPRVSASAEGLVRGKVDAIEKGDPRLLESGLILQPYLPEIERTGELSLVYIDGEFSHTVRKLPREGDFRVQVEFGATTSTAVPSRTERRLADHALGVLREVPLYARVDIVPTARGPLLMEFELIEPELFFAFGRHAASRFADALRRRTTERTATSPLGSESIMRPNRERQGLTQEAERES